MTDYRPEQSGGKRAVVKGCLLGMVVLALLPVLLYGGCHARKMLRERAAAKAQEAAAEAAFSPVAEKMAEAAEEARQARQVDLDRTIRVIHEIDLALEQHGSIKEYLAYLAGQDYRGVAPEVLEARQKVLDVLMKLYAKQTELEDQESLWNFSSEFLFSMLSVVQVELRSGDGLLPIPSAGIGLDRGKAQKMLDELKSRREGKTRLLADIRDLETEILTTVMGYSEVYYRYVAEWDRLCLHRDRAYLAAHAGDWATVVESADRAIAQAANEKEAHLLKAMAMLEMPAGSEIDDTPALVIEGLDSYMERHPDSTAPALLLQGNAHLKRGERQQAQLLYQQAAVYYPKQAEQLADMLNPYRMRSFLRKTREGTYILKQYKATMLGAGYFSPDLQLARLHFDAGDFEAGRQKVMDHFARRRNQAQWDFVIDDIRFCYRLMGDDFERIFPRDHYLTLVAEPAMMSSTGLAVTVRNDSDVALSNCTLILCLNLTDMYADDYETLVPERTLPHLPAGEGTDFGTITVDLELFGKQKTVADIVSARAILISNEAVVWVDTDDYKFAELADRARRQRRYPVDRFAMPVNDALGKFEEMAARLDPSFGKDHVSVQLPAGLAILKPVFRLAAEGRVFAPAANRIEGDRIHLQFKDVVDAVAAGDSEGSKPLELQVNTRLGEMRVGLSLEKGNRIRVTRLEAPGRE